VLEGPLQHAVAPQIDVVRILSIVVDVARHTRSQSNFGCAPLPYTFSAPFSPVAFGR